MMKTKIFKILAATLLVFPYAGTAVRANTITEEEMTFPSYSAGSKADAPSAVMKDSVTVHGEDINDEFEIPEDAVESGVAGVQWYIGQDGVLNFEAGMLDRTDNWQGNNITGIRVVPTKAHDKLILPEDCTKLFNGLLMPSLQFIETQKFDTSRVKNMSFMFGCCTELKNVDVTGFDTRNAESMQGMFICNYSLTNLDLSNFNTGKVQDMSWMFSGCHSLTELDLSSFDTGNVMYMNRMFGGCAGLTALDLSGFDTGSLISTEEMFLNCAGLTTLDLSSFDTSQISCNNSHKMLSGTSSLQKLNLSKNFF
ncbi:MAG: BspA family leucine-rich repeat surface protein, partial [Erysipelotrichaceae bacterium]|nr:BspA family leucine-rich repeat surface protein [Erysipelotrichaceae bacterium]